MKKASFKVFLIWSVVFVFLWHIFEILPNNVFATVKGFTIDTRLIATFTAQSVVIGIYFHFFQKEKIKNAAFRSVIFNFLIYMVYFFIIWRANSI